MRAPIALLSAGLLFLAGCGTPPAPPILDKPATSASWTGWIHWEAHLDRPHALRSRIAQVRLARDGDRVHVLLEERDRPNAPVERTILLLDERDRCWVQLDSASHFEAADRGAEHLLRSLLLALDPERPGSPAMHWQHPRYGDLVAAPAWDVASDGTAPQLHVRWHRESDQAELVLHRVDDPVGALSPFEAIDFAALRAQPTATTSTPVSPTFRTLAPRVHEVTLADVDTRSLAIEFADHLVLCETSLDNAAGERLLACLDRHLPDKPVRYVLFSHYHPHYTGGLRPVLARGTTVVAPQLGAAYASEITTRPFREPPDALTRSGRTPAVETLVGQRAFRDDHNELIAIDIGADSHHTAEYVVFWLPRARLLFEGDLGWHTVGEGIRPNGDRARGLVKSIDSLGLPVETLVQSWPTRGRSTLPLADLRALLAGR